ncbi:hypothetical protein GBA65_16420 [Rubrobacter marinus]|uniref:Gram-positive cocci surface proteins LPxTG domain-containing protein n=1 Tax=Rubrobacter marinus TaxID=2653852 RepID=A0A6G8Q063_9ACTN|nr:hypothetical protein [Rubrobacter marinus]QIN79852.1 hypothetical protein GBA65_16420 [Rubrobacter marinus]
MKRLFLLVAAMTLALAVPGFAQSETTQQEPVTLEFELTIEGLPPADATFFGQVGSGMRDVREQLTDADGDGVYTGSVEYTPDERDVVVILQGKGVRYGDDGAPSPGAPETVIRDFGSTAVEGDRTFSATASFGDEGAASSGPVSATGVVEKPQMTTYMYGTHAITDEETGTPYALTSEDVDLDAYVGEEVTVYGAPVPGYEGGEIEGGPALLEVGEVEPVAGVSEEEATVVFELSIEGEVPEDYSFYVESSVGDGGVICTTDATVVEEAGYPECRPDAVNTAEVPFPAGEPFDYRVLRSRGTELSSFVLDEGSEVSEDGLVIEASYSAANDPANGEDINEDGVINEADGELASQTSEAADAATRPDEAVLPDTGGPPLSWSIGGAASCAALLAALVHRSRRSKGL